MLNIIQPELSFKESYNAYIKELGDEERYPFPLDYDHSNFESMLKRISGLSTGLSIPEGMVQSSTYWLIDNHEIIGCTNIRHYLNKEIEHCGGHIGLSIRPSHRGLGLSKTLLTMSIEKARELGVKTIHIHCHTNNAASKAMIEACGGVLHSKVLVGDEEISRYRHKKKPLE